MIGQTFSHYKITAKLGAGGMGEVFLATDTTLDRQVALKFLPESLRDNPEARGRLVREAKAASKLNHPNILAIYAVESDQNRDFIVMEYVEGHSLTEHLAQRSHTLNDLIEIALQIAAGLGKAHQSGVLHRDIKPSNVLVDTEGRVRILDFGLATFTDAARLTQTGSTLGTAAYMSPELARGRACDHRADLFSFGVVLYEMVTGQLPFRGDHPVALAYAICNETPEPIARYKSVAPDELQLIISKSLAKDPEERYQSAADLSADLKRLRTAGATPQTPAASRRKMLAVLPFENLGAAEDEFFADGITEEIISRLAAVSKLGVISRTSAMHYKGTHKALREIGSELGVDYVLEGTVRWGRSPAGPSRVRITPQLIKVQDDTHLWSDRYDRVIDDIFAIQSEIAEEVLRQLHVTLIDSERGVVQARPTENLDAYQSFLRGLEYSRQPDYRRDNFKLAQQLFQHAVDLDTGFALAHAELSIAHSTMFLFNIDPTPARLELAKASAETALKLQSDLPEAHKALGLYYYRGFRDFERAIAEFNIAANLRPNDSGLLLDMAAVRRRQGRMPEALDLFRRAMDLSPRDALLPTETGTTCLLMRRYAAAEQYIDRSLALAPDQSIACVWKSTLYELWQGDLARSRAALERLPRHNAPEGLGKWGMLRLYERQPEQTLTWLDGLSVKIIDDQAFFAPVGLMKAWLLDSMGNHEGARSEYEATLTVLKTELEKRPDDGRILISLGHAHAGLGHREEALDAGRRACEALPVSKDALIGSMRIYNLAKIRATVGETESALNDLEYLLSIPCACSGNLLKIDPHWDRLRDNSRFQALVSQPDKVF